MTSEMVGMVGPGGPRPCIKEATATQLQLKAAMEDFSPVLLDWLGFCLFFRRSQKSGSLHENIKFLNVSQFKFEYRVCG